MGRNKAGKRDTTGPHKKSYQRKKYGVGKRKMRGEKCVKK